MSANYKLCTSCNTQNRPNARFCKSCGTRFEDIVEMVKKKLRTVDGKQNKCEICLLEVFYDMSRCPSCKNIFHYNHLMEWMKRNDNTCPVCKQIIVVVD